MARGTWTDERLDDLTKHMDEGFREVRADLRQRREEFTALRKEFAEVKSQGAKTDARIDELARSMQIWCWLIVSFLVALMGMFAAQL